MDVERLREGMVERQIAARGVRDKAVLAAMRRVPRHLFMPASVRAWAYEDRAVSIGSGQTISQPYMVALMTDALGVQPGHRVLEVGTGSGYQAAVLAAMGGEVLSIERHPALAATARATLEAVGMPGVSIRVGDGTLGAPDAAPFDRILVTAASPAVPEPLRTQLAPDGRLVIPVGSRGLQYLTIVTRHSDGTFDQTRSYSCVFVPLVGQYGWDSE